MVSENYIYIEQMQDGERYRTLLITNMGFLQMSSKLLSKIKEKNINIQKWTSPESAIRKALQYPKLSLQYLLVRTFDIDSLESFLNDYED